MKARCTEGNAAQKCSFRGTEFDSLLSRVAITNRSTVTGHAPSQNRPLPLLTIAGTF